MSHQLISANLAEPDATLDQEQEGAGKATELGFWFNDNAMPELAQLLKTIGPNDTAKSNHSSLSENIAESNFAPVDQQFQEHFPDWLTSSNPFFSPWSESFVFNRAENESPFSEKNASTENSAKTLHKWFAVPVGNHITLFYDSEKAFDSSAVVMAAGLGTQAFFPQAAGVVVAGAAGISLWQDLTSFAKSRSSCETAKYALGTIADTAVIAGGVGSILKTMPSEMRAGLIGVGFMGRMLVELIPNLVKVDESN